VLDEPVEDADNACGGRDGDGDPSEPGIIVAEVHLVTERRPPLLRGGRELTGEGCGLSRRRIR